MKILFLSHYYAPHIGGVEKHLQKVAEELDKNGHNVVVLTEKHEKNLKTVDYINSIRVVRFNYPHVKFLGLFLIWLNLWQNRKLIKNSDIVHVHDVFIWYLPFKLIYPRKKVFTTFHGWEGEWPIPKRNIFFKKLAAKLSRKNICVGEYIQKYYEILADKIIYGGADKTSKFSGKKIKNKVVFVGRLEKDTGLERFLKDLKKHKDTFFIGDGSLRAKCEEYGTVTGFTDPTPFYKTAEYAVPGGYLSYIDAKSYGCKIITYADNPLKKDYWEEIKKIEKFPSWGQVADEYIDLYNSSK